MDFFCGSAAACAAVTLTNPLEVVRTLFQLRHELQSGPVQPFHLLRYIRSEGILSLQRGLSAALPYQFIMNGVRLSLFDLLKDGTILWTVMAAGVCGGVGAFMASPFNLVKTRLQSRSSTLTDHGMVGWWKGAMTSTVRTAVGSGAQLSSYEFCKRHFSSDSWTPSIIASLMTIVFMNPFDVVMTRMYNQRGTEMYGNILDCFGKIYCKEGWRGFYKGFLPNYVRLGPHTILTLTFYDHLKQL